MLYFHSFKNPGFVLDIVQDIRRLNELSRESRKAGMIVLGGGVCKHQIANAMLIVSVFSFLFTNNNPPGPLSETVQTTPYLSCVAFRKRLSVIATASLQNTGQEFDGSDSGARPDEAVSWGKIRAGAEAVKVGYSDVRHRPRELMGSRCSLMQR
jgi:deoxyhypusine synthase